MHNSKDTICDVIWDLFMHKFGARILDQAKRITQEVGLCPLLNKNTPLGDSHHLPQSDTTHTTRELSYSPAFFLASIFSGIHPVQVLQEHLGGEKSRFAFSLCFITNWLLVDPQTDHQSAWLFLTFSVSQCNSSSPVVLFLFRKGYSSFRMKYTGQT